MVHGEGTSTVGQQATFAFLDRGPERTARHPEPVQNRPVRALSQANNNERVNDLDLAPQKPSAVAEPRILNLALETTA